MVSVQSIHDGQNWEVLGGAFTYTQTINLHFVHTEYVRDLVRLLWSYVGMNVTQLCLFGIDCTSTCGKVARNGFLQKNIARP